MANIGWYYMNCKKEMEMIRIKNELMKSFPYKII